MVSTSHLAETLTGAKARQLRVIKASAVKDGYPLRGARIGRRKFTNELSMMIVEGENLLPKDKGRKASYEL